MSTKSVAGKSGEFLKFQFKVKSNATYGNSADAYLILKHSVGVITNF